MLCALATGLAAPSHGQGARQHGPEFVEPSRSIVIPAGREQRTVALLDDVGFDRPDPGGLVWKHIGIAQAQVTFTLHRAAAASPGGVGPPVARITLRHRDDAGKNDRLGSEFALQLEALEASADVARALERAAASILKRDTGGYFQATGEASARAPLIVALALLGAWLLAVVIHLTARRRWSQVRLRFKATHLLPALLQVTIFAYWSSQVAEVSRQIPTILGQVALAYALDFLMGMTVRGSWDLTFGPLPIVLSTNLFVWFPPGFSYLAGAVIAIAIGSKWLVHRAGRHIFNPSALGIAVIGAGCLLLGKAMPFLDIAHLISEPPRMLALIVGLGCIAQARVPIVLITLSAALVLLGCKHAGLYHVVYPLWPAILIALVLLATDPATIPQGGVAKLLYGMTFGVLVWAVSAALDWRGESDFFGKVLPLPLVNLLVPVFESVGSRCEEELGRLPGKAAKLANLLAPRYNWIHMALWLALVAAFRL